MTFQWSPSHLIAIERELSRRSLADFVKMSWRILEPARTLKWGWVLDGICAHLEGVTRGEIKNLLMNVPPGTMKSLITCVFWPAWEWGPQGKPHLRVIGTAHKESLAIRDNLKCRRLIQSDWYQQRWPIAFSEDTKTKFENAKTGFRSAMAFTTMTGDRGDRVILDDPISAHHANSQAHLEDARLAFTETLPSRINDGDSAIVVIMQRLHQKDVSGVILDMGLPYVHFSVPMEFDEETSKSTRWYFDPRSKPGELMFPERFPADEVAKLKKTLGSYATAGQLQQRPAPRGGGMFKREWFLKTVFGVPDGTKWCRGWDLAASEDAAGAATAGVLMGLTPDGRIILGGYKREHFGPAGVKSLVKSTALADDARGYGKVRQDLPQDPGQAGKVQKADFVRELAGHDVHVSPEVGDKEDRALPFAAQCEAGNVFLLLGVDHSAFIDEAATFPTGKWKDQIDAASRAYGALVTNKSKSAWVLTR